MWTRRKFLGRSAVALAGLAGASDLLLGSKSMPDGSASKGMVTPAAQQAIDSGLEYLARKQDGRGNFGTGQYRGNVAVTSLAGLAFLAGGNQPGRGRYGHVVNLAVDAVLSHEVIDTPGFLYNKRGTPHGPMYGHGFGTLFLAEVHGMVQDRERRNKLRATLKRAVDLIVRGQNGEGGWRYQPTSKDADISVTICQVMALRAARNAGFYVPKSTIDHCIKYVKNCQDHDGGFRYMAQGGGTAFARSAAGVVALHSAGVYQGPAVEAGLKYLMKFKPSPNQARHHEMHYYYGHYYAAQAMWTAGGTHWSEWYPAIRDELLSKHRSRSEPPWFDQICSHYGTAMACIILQIPNNVLPILQK